MVIAKNSRKPLPEQRRLLALLTYDPLTGVLRWRKNGKVAGWRESTGYWAVQIGGRRANGGERYQAHLLIWVMQTGREPIGVDHIDLDGCNNRWVNFREATKTENQANRCARRDNALGVKGIHYDPVRKLYVAQLCRGGRRFHVGRFRSLDMAKDAYQSKAIEIYGEFARMS